MTDVDLLKATILFIRQKTMVTAEAIAVLYSMIDEIEQGQPPREAVVPTVKRACDYFRLDYKDVVKHAKEMNDAP